MNAALVEEVKAWIADDPDPVTAAHLQGLLDAGDEAALKPLFNGFFNSELPVFVDQLAPAHHA